MIIDRSKLQLKYYLSVFPLLDEYPTKEDILYELLNHFEETGAVDNIMFTAPDVSEAFMKPIKLSDLTNILDSMCDEYLSTSQADDIIVYSIKYNPWK